MNKNLRILLYTLSPIVCFILELLVYFKQINLDHFTLSCVVIIVDIILLATIIIVKKNKNFFKQSLSVALRGGFASIAGFLLVIYFLIHIAWLTDNLQEAFKADQLSTHYALLSFGFLFLPFLINALLTPKPLSRIIPGEDRKVLVSALSLNTPETLQMFRKEDFNGGSISSILKRFWNWQPVINMLDFYPNLKEMIVIQSDLVYQHLQTEKQDSGSNDDAFDALMKKRYSHIKYTPFRVSDMDIFDDTYNDLKLQFNKYFSKHGYKDENIVFGISSGTAVLTACLLFLALPGSRGTAYQPQKPGAGIDEFEVDILTIEELWEEIFDRFSMK